MRAVVLIALAACVEPSDYASAGKGNQATAALEDCRANRYLPCGWVHVCPGVPRDNPIGALEQCVLWNDRIAPYPVGIDRAMESLYGDCPLSWHERFDGIPLCRYTCPSVQGCNSFDGCMCLDEPAT